MTSQQALNAIQAHYETGAATHDPIPTIQAGLTLILNRLNRAQITLSSSGRPPNLELCTRRLLQTAGLIVKTVVNLEMSELDPEETA